MSIKEAIILAGGLGTRLKEAVPDLPKAMAQVAERPFLAYIIDYLRMQGIERFIFSLGYRSEIIEQYLAEQYSTLNYTYVKEKEPLGTGGGIKLALEKVEGGDVCIVNGDTLFKVDLSELEQFHFEKKAECTLALKKMENSDRYGIVTLTPDQQIISFEEKKFFNKGFINGGIYLLNIKAFDKNNLSSRFSFEKDFLEQNASEGRIYGLEQRGYFIDIGIPSDYEKAGKELAKAKLDYTLIDDSWTLFLDRDGVINNERLGKYVLNWDEFVFGEGVLAAFNILGKKFKRILLVSNQRGVTKQLMSEDDLKYIHEEMLKEISANGAKIERIYYCIDKEDKHPSRKPNPGMAFQAKKDFPNIDFSKAIMVGNKPSDMKFGRSAGMFTVFVTTTNPDQDFPHPDIDAIYPSLLHFAQALES